MRISLDAPCFGEIRFLGDADFCLSGEVNWVFLELLFPSVAHLTMDILDLDVGVHAALFLTLKVLCTVVCPAKLLARVRGISDALKSIQQFNIDLLISIIPQFAGQLVLPTPSFNPDSDCIPTLK